MSSYQSYLIYCISLIHFTHGSIVLSEGSLNRTSCINCMCVLQTPAQRNHIHIYHNTEFFSKEKQF